MFRKNNFGQPIGETIQHWKSASLPAKTMLEGRRCKLEPLNIDEHAEYLFSALVNENTDDSWTYLPYGPFDSYAAFLKWLKNFALTNDPFFYAIIDKKMDRPLGLASYLRINPEAGSIEVGHLHYSNKLKQTHIATEAMYLMMKHAFEELGYRRYEWKCDSLNKPSIEAAVRLGFHYEGTFRQAQIYKDRNRDTAWFSIIDKEWPPLKMKLTKWLHPDNFHENGQQKCRLQDVNPQSVILSQSLFSATGPSVSPSPTVNPGYSLISKL